MKSMTKSKKFAVSLCVVLGLAVAAPTAAIANTQYPKEGGVWNYGWVGFNPFNRAWSEYTVNRPHGSSVYTTYKGQPKNSISICTASGVTSKAAVNTFDGGSDSYYYKVC